MKMVKILLLVSLGTLLSGCNTARGVGADLEILGRKMQGLDSDAVMVTGNPPESNVVEVPTTYQSGQTYESYATGNSAAVPSDYQSVLDGYDSGYQADTDPQVYSTPYEDETTYSNLPDAITYPVE